MLAGFFFVAEYALGLSRHDVAGDMGIERGYFYMAAGTGIFAMYRSPISNRRNHILVALQADFGSDGHAAFCQNRFGWYKQGHSKQYKSKDSAIHSLTS
jgi:hypothetical protein